MWFFSICKIFHLQSTTTVLCDFSHIVAYPLQYMCFSDYLYSMTLQLPKIGPDEDRKLYDKAMKRGYAESALPLVLFVGVTGSGKTLFK